MKARHSCLALAAAVVLAGCGSSPTPSATSSVTTATAPSPSPTCSPFDSTPRPCSPAEFSKTRQQNELIAEAEQTYRAFWKENVRLQREGGTNKATQPLLDTLEGAALKSVMDIHRELKVNKTRATGGSFQILSITPRPTRTKNGSVMSLTVCWRTKGLTYPVDGVNLKRDATIREDSNLPRVNGKLKIFAFESEKVSKC